MLQVSQLNVFYPTPPLAALPLANSHFPSGRLSARIKASGKTCHS